MRKRLTDVLPSLTAGLLALQPFLDALSYWQTKLQWTNAVTLALRLGILLLCGVLGLLLSSKKWVYALFGGLLLLLTGGHVLACLQTGYEGPLEDLTNLLHIYTLPLLTLCFSTFLRQNRRTLEGIKLGAVLSLGGILLVMLLATVTGTDPHTYSNEGTGVLGWFLWTNTQSAVLSMLLPLALAWALGKFGKRILPVVLVALAGECALFLLAPRLAYAALVGVGLGTALCLILGDRSRWKQALALLLCTLLFVGLYPLSPMAKRRREAAAQAQINAAHAQERAEDAEGTPEERLLHLYLGYEYQYGTIQRFGAERVMAAYDYTDDPAVLSDQRLRKRTFCRLLMEDAPLLGHIFGLEVGDMRVPMVVSDDFGKTWYQGYQVNDVENDFLGIYYLLGWTGLLLWLAGIGYILLRALLALIRRPRETFTPDWTGFVLAAGVALIHTIFTASLLRRNNGGIYFAPVLAGLLYLSLPHGKKEGTALAGTME